MIEPYQGVQKNIYHQSSQVEISDLPVEVHDLIFFHVPTLSQVRRMGAVCRCWYALSQAAEKNRIENARDIEAISFLALSLIMKRKDSTDDLRITNFCKQAALAAGNRFDMMDPITQMIITIGRLYNENPHRALEDLKKVEIGKCIIDAANNNNAFAQFILGLATIKDPNLEGIFFVAADSSLKRALNCGRKFLRRKLPFNRKKTPKTEHQNPPAKQNLLIEAYNQGVFDAGYFLPDLSGSFLCDFLYRTVEEAAKRGSVLAAVAWFKWDTENAYVYLVEAAKKEHAPAQYFLGKSLYEQYLMGPKVDQVEEKRKEITYWIGKAALQNHPAAQMMLGKLIASGFDDVLSYLDQMKDNNLDTVHVEHGIRFSKVNENHSESYFSLYLSADSQDTAYSNLSLIYFYGKFVEKDLPKAIEYASKCNALTQKELNEHFGVKPLKYQSE